MKFLAVASLAALAVATPALEARDGWEAYTTTTTWYDPATWVPYTTTAKWVEPTTWAPYPTTTAKYVEPEWEEWYKAPKYTTTVVTAITTYCPEPTTMVHAGKTYVVTKATTITITDCPCTVSVPIYVKTSTSCSEKPAAATTWAAVPVVDTTKKVEATTWAAYDTSKSVMPTTTNVWSPIATYKGAADRVNVGAGLAGVVGIAALLL